MRDLKPPFQFNFSKLIAATRRKLNNRVGGIEIALPFLNISVCPDDMEQQVAREIVIRMADRRVLNSFECCDNCIDNALASLQEIRDILVNKQVKLSKATDGPLYIVIEFMLGAIRQFLTFEQRLKDKPKQELWMPASSSFHCPYDEREVYFAALEMLRAHLYRCLVQVAAIAQVKIPKIADNIRYDEAWQLEAYQTPPAIIALENKATAGLA